MPCVNVGKKPPCQKLELERLAMGGYDGKSQGAIWIADDNGRMLSILAGYFMYFQNNCVEPKLSVNQDFGGVLVESVESHALPFVSTASTAGRLDASVLEAPPNVVSCREALVSTQGFRIIFHHFML